jgi:DNA polymerase-4
LVRMADGVGTRMREARLSGRTVTIKVRYGDRTTITRSHTVPNPLDSPRAVAAVSEALLDTVEVSSGVRLLGVAVSALVDSTMPFRQLSFEDAALDGPATTAIDPERRPVDGRGSVVAVEREERAEAWHDVEAAVSAIRTRYGHASIGPAALVSEDGLSVKQRGDTQWGPTDDPGDDP